VAMSGNEADQKVATGIRDLLEWAHAAQTASIPEAVLRKAAIVIADNVAAMVAARAEPEVRCVHEQLLAAGGRGEAVIFCGGAKRTDRLSAALGNGIAGSWCELDEGYRLAPCHAGLYTLPALLAEAEALDLTVEETLRAAVVAYEVTARFARCWVFPQLALHPHPQTAAVGGAIASALARGLNVRQLTDAVTAAVTLITVGDYRHAVEGALVRNVWAAVGCTNGMRAADWAQCGIGGLLRGPYAVYTELLGQPPAPGFLAADLGREWAITQGYHKIHACCQSTHSAVEAMLEARARMPRDKDAGSIRRITLETHRPGMSNKQPVTTLAAKFSFEHVVATAHAYGHAGHEAFSAATLNEPRVKELREKVELVKYEPIPPRPHDRPARITLHFDDGSALTTECLSARGGPDQPFAEEVIIDKIGRITAGVYPNFFRPFRALLDGDSSVKAKRWSAIVREFTAA
jgi:2-methylcitrate dehydratase PrpD